MFEGMCSSCIHGADPMAQRPHREASVGRAPLVPWLEHRARGVLVSVDRLTMCAAPVDVGPDRLQHARYSTVVVEGIDASLRYPA